jgi:hypothetical protein
MRSYAMLMSSVKSCVEDESGKMYEHARNRGLAKKAFYNQRHVALPVLTAIAIQRLAFNACELEEAPPCRCTVLQTIATIKQLDFGIFIGSHDLSVTMPGWHCSYGSPGLAKDWSRRLELDAVVRIKPSQKSAQTFISIVVKVKKSW